MKDLMKITIRIDTQNDAFRDESWENEVRKILSKVCNSITERNSVGGNISDTNGNKVGDFVVKCNKECK